MTSKKILFVSLFFVILGLVFIFSKPSIIASIYFPVVGLGFILMGIVKLVFLNPHLDTKREFSYNLVEGILGIVCGVTFCYFYRHLAIDIACFVLLGLVPVLRLVTSEHFYNQLAFDSLKYIGLLSILGGEQALNKIFFYVMGSIWFIIAILIVIYYFVMRRRYKGGKEN